MNPGDDHSSPVVGHCWVEGPSMLESAYLHNVLIPAVPVPFDAQGKSDASAQERYARWMAQQPIEGVAVWAHTGRGLRLAETERALVLECWRNSVPAPRLVIAAAGGSLRNRDVESIAGAAGGRRNQGGHTRQRHHLSGSGELDRGGRPRQGLVTPARKIITN